MKYSTSHLKSAPRLLGAYLLFSIITLSSLNLFGQNLDEYRFGVTAGSESYPLLAKKGYHFVEPSTPSLFKPNLADPEFQAYAKALTEKGIVAPITNGFLHIKVVGPNKNHQAALDYCKRIFSRAKHLGVKKIVFGSQGSRTPPKGYSAEQTYKDFVAFLKILIPEAKKHNLIISLEPLTNDPLMLTIEQAARMCEEVNQPDHLGITADFWHMINNNDAPENIVKYAKHIKHIHLAEKKNRTTPGVNNQDFSPYWDALIQSGYKGSISIEGSWPTSHTYEKHGAKALEIIKKGLRDAINKNSKKTSSVSYDNNPLGTLEKPLLLRTYVPDPGLSDTVLSNHHQGSPSPKYSPHSGKNTPGEYQPLNGIPAAIAVNHGTSLSYVWDTTESRLLYAWKDGFLDMKPYWGTSDKGNRTGYSYLPKLTGTLTYLTKDYHPLHLNGTPIGTPRYLGYTLQNNQPTFRWKANNTVVNTSISALPKKAHGSLTIQYKTQAPHTLSYHGPKSHKVVKNSPQHLTVTIQPDPSIQNIVKKSAQQFKGITVARGEHLFTKYSCQMCHTTDGGKSHGPTLKGLAGIQRKFGDKEIIADDLYLFESIAKPNAKIVPGYQPNYMPKFPLSKDETESLVLYIKSFTNISE